MKRALLLSAVFSLFLAFNAFAAQTEAPAVEPASSPEVSAPAQAAPAPTQAAAPAQGSGSFVSDLAQFTHDASAFLGDAIHTMTTAMQYLYGGIGVAGTFQGGFNQANGILTNGPPQLPFPVGDQPAPAPANPPASDGAQTPAPPEVGPEAGPTQASANAASTTTKQFRDDMNSYKQLGLEEQNVLQQIQANPSDGALKEIQQQIQGTKKEKMTKILLALAYDIETKKYEKLHLMVEYLNSQGPDTIKLFYEVINETKSKLQISFIEAGNFGMTLDLQIVDGKLELVLSIGTGTGAPEPLPTVPLGSDGQAPAPAPPSDGAAIPQVAKGGINLNSASAKELEKLPFIGEKMAERIIEYRNTNGGFNSIEDLKKIPGISDKKFDTLKDLVTK
jgi:competence ComEA-like helix-hairpin-helix protein